jgi:NAD(P)-dependent dehydrogenase (short-subunit alcohol dehydrogenase family)
MEDDVIMQDDIMKQFDLRGKVAVITGAGGALCGKMAEALALVGVHVAVLDIHLEKARAQEEAIIKTGGTAKAFGCDVLDETQLKECYREISALWGPPDFLINGAGGNDPRGTTTREFLEINELDKEGLKGFFDLDFEGFQHVFNLNFLGTFLPTKVMSRGMVERGSGAIVNISSMSALTPLTKTAAYSPAKAAVSNFTRWLAVHFSHTGVRVNALAPGFFMTEQLCFLHVNQKTGEYTPRAKKVLAHTPAGRYGEPEDLVGTVIYLLSDASRFVTGAVIPIDGGFSSYTI